MAGRVGSVEAKSDIMVVISLSHRKNRDETEWTSIAFTNPTNGTGQKLADLANNYIEMGQYLTVIANMKENGGYQNYYAAFVDLGLKSNNA